MLSSSVSERSRLLELERERARRAARSHLLPFTLWTFPEYQVNWHHRVIADYLTQLVLGDVRRLILTVGPRRGKSELASRRLPAFALGHFPDWEVIATSWGADLANDMSRDCKRIILSDEYRDLFPGTSLNPRHVVSDDRQAAVNTADRWDVIGRKGRYTGKGIGGGITGKGFTLGIIDDPFKDEEQARSQTHRDKVWEWYRKVFWTRRSPDARIVVMHTRWHQDDLVGRLLHEANTRRTADQWTVVNLREIREDEDNPDDPRDVGEVLWPERYSLAEAQELSEADPSTFAALYQQHPAPPGGNIVKQEWLNAGEYDYLPDGPGEWRVYGDLKNGSKQPRSSLACYGVWFLPHSQPSRRYLVEVVTGRWDQVEEERELKALRERYPMVGKIGLEDKADARGVIAHLRDAITGLVPIKAVPGDKADRLRACLHVIQSGCLMLPRRAPWRAAYDGEVTMFPGASNDDQVDMTTLALNDMLSERQGSATLPWWAKK